MAYNTKINLDNKHVCQSVGSLLTLSGITKYNAHPTFTGATQLVDKQYVDMQASGASGSTIYNLQSPSTVAVGGLPAETILLGKSSNCILKEILTPYQLPTFSSFSTTQVTPVEVGTVISGSQSFSWGFGNGTNVQNTTMCIIDVTNSTAIASNITITSPQSATIATKTFTTCGQTHEWCGSAKNTCNNNFNSSSASVTALLPYFWGKCTCPGPAGANRPTATAAMITGGTKIIANSSVSLGINFNSGANDYLWFAVPASVGNKTCWCVDAINNGGIGGSVGAGCCLFPTADAVVGVANACWSGQSYKVYISNKQTSQTLSMLIS